MIPFNKTINHLKNDKFYLTMRDWFNNDFAFVQKWFYELMFYKKCLFRVTTDPCMETPELLYETCRVNKFNCGPRRKVLLLTRYGHDIVHIKFRNGKSIVLPVDRILNVYGWKYILNNVEDIINNETGEVIFYTKF